MQFHTWDPEVDGDYSETAMINKLEMSGYTCACYTYPPGTCFPEHVHDVDKIDAVIKGRFRLTVRGKEFLLQPGDSISIPAGTPHTAEVIGDEAVVAIDAVKSA